MTICWDIILQPQSARCKIRGSLRNRPFAAKPFRSPYPHFAAVKSSAKSPKASKPPFRSPSSISQLRNTPLAHECHFAAPSPHFPALRNGLQNWDFVAKWPLLFEKFQPSLRFSFKLFKFQIFILNRSFLHLSPSRARTSSHPL